MESNYIPLNVVQSESEYLFKIVFVVSLLEIYVIFNFLHMCNNAMDLLLVPGHFAWELYAEAQNQFVREQMSE